jgi:dTDP-4-dehydrorhamnose 3,5-epimerase
LIKDYPLKGVRTYDLNLIPDERGFFSEVLRNDWQDFVQDTFLQVNWSYSYPDVVRAWHKHVRGQVDYFFVPKGALKICAYDEESKKLIEIVSTDRKPMLVRVPGHYLHGFRNVSNEPGMLIYFVNKLYDYKNPDEIRVPWNDPTINPKEINGNSSDPRVGQPWDWFCPPYK